MSTKSPFHILDTSLAGTAGNPSLRINGWLASSGFEPPEEEGDLLLVPPLGVEAPSPVVPVALEPALAELATPPVSTVARFSPATSPGVSAAPSPPVSAGEGGASCVTPGT